MNTAPLRSDATVQTLLHIAAVLERLLDQTLLEQFGIGMAQYRIFTVFEGAPSPSQREIATVLDQTEAGISRQIKILTSKGLLITKTAAKDRRQHVCHLTPKGAKLFAAAQKLVRKTTDTTLANIDIHQQKELSKVLACLHDRLCNTQVCSIAAIVLK